MNKYRVKDVYRHRFAVSMIETLGFAIIIVVNSIAPYVLKYHVLIENIIIAIVGTITVSISIRLMKRLYYLESFFRVCAWCKKIHDGHEWVEQETFLQSGLKAIITHGICEKCSDDFKKEYQDV